MNATAATILVVDDEPDLRTLYELTLLREGYRVQTAGSVGEAREQLQNQTFDAVITDMRLPDGLGMDKLLHQRIGVGHHLGWRALGGDTARTQNNHLVGHAKGFF